MTRRYLGELFAIHGGEADLLFPHHEAEIAQAEYGSAGLPARYWIRTALVRQDGRKIRKSLGNMTFVSYLLLTYSGAAIRLALLRPHCRRPWSFDRRAFDKAQDIVNRLQRGQEIGEATPGAVETSSRGFLEALANDLDTPTAIDSPVSLAEPENTQERRRPC